MRSRSSNPEIDKLILLISKLPGFGPKSASRAALHLLKKKDKFNPVPSAGSSPDPLSFFFSRQTQTVFFPATQTQTQNFLFKACAFFQGLK